MTYAVHSLPGAQPVANTSTVQNHVLGTRIKATDPTYGEGEFVYLLGVASTVVGSMVTWDATTHQTTLTPDTAGIGSSFAFAMSANVASQYGWYQVAGLAVAKKTNVAWEPQKAVYQSGTTGRVMDTVASGKQVAGARSANLATVVTSTSTIILQINHPHNTGVII